MNLDKLQKEFNKRVKKTKKHKNSYICIISSDKGGHFLFFNKPLISKTNNYPRVGQMAGQIK